MTRRSPRSPVRRELIGRGLIGRGLIRRGLVGLALLSAAACSSSLEEPGPRSHARGVEAPPPAASAPARLAPIDDVPALPEARYPMPARVVAVGDVHGDLAAFRAVLRAAGAIDERDRWIGGDLVVVQTGDLLDRGDDEPEVLALVARLEEEAPRAGGRFIALHGNHELMNVGGDYRYVSEDGFHDYAGFSREASPAARRTLPPQALGRAGAFEPRSRFARTFAARNTAVVVGDTVFVHAGISAEMAERGIEAINEATRSFDLGDGAAARWLMSPESPVWYRGYARAESPEVCGELERALERLGAARMVIGHTPQDEGVTFACEGRVVRIDTGLSRFYGGPRQALELTTSYDPRDGGRGGTRVLEAPRAGR